MQRPQTLFQGSGARLSVALSLHLSVSLYLTLSLCVPLCPSVTVSVYLSVFLSVSLLLPFCLYVSLLVNLSHPKPLLWCHNEHDGVSNHQPHHCLLNRSFRRRSKKTSKLHITSLCAGNSPVTGEFPAQMASDAENVSIWWRHHAMLMHYRPQYFMCLIHIG